MFRATKALRASGVNAGEPAPKLSQQLTHNDPRPEHKKLVKEARKDPELYVGSQREIEHRSSPRGFYFPELPRRGVTNR